MILPQIKEIKKVDANVIKEADKNTMKSHMEKYRVKLVSVNTTQLHPYLDL